MYIRFLVTNLPSFTATKWYVQTVKLGITLNNQCSEYHSVGTSKLLHQPRCPQTKNTSSKMDFSIRDAVDLLDSASQ